MTRRTCWEPAGADVEVLPLYARLSATEQQRIFKPHAKRRVVLATNVAETSLTVPGIRYVVDPGTARISRYSARLKVQRLPIEPISQASADQRKGRCGRTSDGICIRLYSEEDFAERPRFTDPEILRTSLASVILQMAAIGLGRVEDFPFLDPPDRRQVRDGIRLLEELGALDAAGRLTKLGRRLADLPVDPRMARMVLEADRLGCAEEVIVIAAALSIQDPRERPSDQTAQADQLHARFADPDSDFVSFLNLWRYLRELQRSLSSNQFRKRCLAEHLHHLRVREWQDLVAQLREAAKGVGVRFNRTPAEPADIHRALLSGLLSHVGVKDDAGRDYTGARGARFAVFPGSGLFKKPPSWVMVAELVETTRLWGRVAARIDPADVEPLAGPPGQAHLQRAALGSAPRVGGGDRAGDAVRAADRHRPHGAVRADRPRAVARAVHPAGAWWRASGRPSTRSSRRTAGWSRRSRSSSTGRGGGTSWSTTRRCSSSSTRACPPMSSRPPGSIAGGGRSGRRGRTCSPTPTRSSYASPTRSTSGRGRRPGGRAISRSTWTTGSSRGPRTTG